jgi:uncharacterized protein YndB with AHSA1/START domain
MPAEPYRASIHIAAAPEVVFEYFTKPEALVRFLTGLSHAIAGHGLDRDAIEDDPDQVAQCSNRGRQSRPRTR